MGEKVTLIRPDGSQINASPEDAETLRTLGYKDQTPEQLGGEAVAKSTEAYYSTPGQKVLTAVEGGLSGLTLGLSDKIQEQGDFDNAERAGYNPGIRLGSELVGGLLPMAGGSIGALAKLSPAGLLATGAEAGGKALAAGKVGQSVISGVIEGGGFGLGATVANSALNGDPLTAESVMAGVGWGGVWGGGLGYGLGKLGARAEARAAARLELETAEKAQGAALRNTEQAWGEFRGGIHDAAEQAKKVTKDASEIFENFGKGNVDATLASVKAARNTTMNAFTLGPDVANMSGREVAAFTSAEARAANKAAGTAYKDVLKAAKEGDYAGLQEATQRFKQHVTTLGEMTGLTVPEIHGFAAAGAKASTNAVTEVAEMTAAAEHLRGMPLTPEKFASMSPDKAEKMFGAVDTFMGGSHAELAGVRDGLNAGIEKLETAAGVTLDGSPAAKLRNVYETLAAQYSKKAEKAVEKAASGVPPWLAGMMGKTAADGARRVGLGGPVATAVYHMTRGLVGLKSAVVGTVNKAATEWVPKVFAKSGRAFTRIEPLATRLDGTQDLGKQTRKELMESRAREIREAAGSVRDTLYKSLSPLADHHPDLAVAMHELGVKQFMFLMNKLPRDPGLAFNRLKSLWSADPAATEKFARYYQVFQNPVAVVQEILKTGQVKPEWAEGLREMHPALFAQLRVTMLERLSDPKILGKLSYNEQVSLGALLQIPLHSTMTPRFVATQQQMYMEKNQKLPMPSQPGADQGGGRPPGAANSKTATSAQKITEH